MEHTYSLGVCTVCGGMDPDYTAYEYYLYGYINGVDYGYEDGAANLGEYKFVDGKLTTTVNNGLPSTDRSITWEDIRTYIIDFLAIIVSSPDYWEDVSVTDTGFAYLMEFKLNDNFGNTHRADRRRLLPQ